MGAMMKDRNARWSPIIWTVVMLLLASVIVVSVLADGGASKESDDAQAPNIEWKAVSVTDGEISVAELKLSAFREWRSTSDRLATPDRLVYEAQILQTVSGSALPEKVLVAVPSVLSEVTQFFESDDSLLIPQIGESYEMHLGRQPALGVNGYELLALQDGVRQIDVGVAGPDGSSQSKYMLAMHAGTVIWLDDEDGYVYVAGGVAAEDARKVGSVREALSLVDGPMGERDVAKYAVDETVVMQLRLGQSVRIGETCLEQEDSYPPIRCAEQVSLLHAESPLNSSTNGLPEVLTNLKNTFANKQDATEFERLRKAGKRENGAYERRMLALSNRLSERLANRSLASMRRVTETEVRDLVLNLPAKGMVGGNDATSLAWPDFFLQRLNKAHGAADFVGGKGLMRFEYWFGETRESYAVVLPALGQIYIVKGKRTQLILGK